MENLTPQAIVAELDKYIVGQHEAKRAMAVALRNRYRRNQLPPEIRKEVLPKNILMIGPTGVGKTEIARRVASLLDAPFVKVEATKFTEVGYVGRDVESIIQDLVENGVNLVHDEKEAEVQSQAETAATERIINALVQARAARRRTGARARKQAQAAASAPPTTALVALSPAPSASAPPPPPEEPVLSPEEQARLLRERARVANLLRKQQLEDEIIEIEVTVEPDTYDSILEFSSTMSPEEVSDTIHEFMEGYNQHHTHGRKRARRVSVREARRILTREEAHKLIDFDQVIDQAVERAEQASVVFIDEIDKICGRRADNGADVSGEGVQRDLLPIVDGSTVQTRYGPVRTDHILFIAAGAFYQHKPSDLLPELQGRFPLRVELKGLNEADLRRILTQPQNSLTKQYRALLGTEGVTLEFSDDGVTEVARLAAQMNERLEDIGARRLHTLMERTLEEISFAATEHKGETITVNAAYVQAHVGDLVKDEDLSRYIL